MDYVKLKKDIKEANIKKELASEKMKEHATKMKETYGVTSLKEAATLLKQKREELGELSVQLEMKTKQLEEKYVSATS